MDGRKDKAMKGGKIIMEKKKFDREEAISLIARGEMDRLLDFNLCEADLCESDLCGANLHRADLCGADLHRADLRGANLCEADLCVADLHKADLRAADLRGANIDYACWPLWCGSLGVKVDVRIARQLAYHLCALDCDDPEYIKARNALLPFANQFHRVQECGILELIEQGVSS
jgi:hypothetical protein